MIATVRNWQCCSLIVETEKTFSISTFEEEKLSLIIQENRLDSIEYWEFDLCKLMFTSRQTSRHDNVLIKMFNNLNSCQIKKLCYTMTLIKFNHVSNHEHQWHSWNANKLMSLILIWDDQSRSLLFLIFFTSLYQIHSSQIEAIINIRCANCTRAQSSLLSKCHCVLNDQQEIDFHHVTFSISWRISTYHRLNSSHRKTLDIKFN